MKKIDDTGRLSSSMIEDDATERLKKRLRDAGLIVNAGAKIAPEPTGEKKNEKKSPR